MYNTIKYPIYNSHLIGEKSIIIKYLHFLNGGAIVKNPFELPDDQDE